MEAKEVWVGIGLGILVIGILLVVFGGFFGLKQGVTGNPIISNVKGVESSVTKANQTCLDSDGGLNYNIYGYTNVSYLGNYTINYDACSVNASILLERYCNGINSAVDSHVCPYGCKNGVCNSQPPTCTDTDGGANYYLRGTANDSQGDSGTDYCISSATIKEYYCSDGLVTELNYNCLLGYSCSNGACLSQNNTCTDTDGGLNDHIYGCTTVSYFGNSTVICDSCLSNGAVSERYCNEEGNSAGRSHLCENGCSNGACVGNQTNPAFDLATTAITFSEDPLVANELVIITKQVKNFGTVAGYIVGGSSSTCLINDPGCSSAGWGGGPGIFIGSGETKEFTEEYIFDQEGSWRVTRSYSGKGVNNETDINLGNNEKIVYIDVLMIANYTFNETLCDDDSDCPAQTTKWCSGDYLRVSYAYFSCQYGNCVAAGGRSHEDLCPYGCLNGACKPKPVLPKCSIWKKIFNPSACQQIAASDVEDSVAMS